MSLKKLDSSTRLLLWLVSWFFDFFLSGHHRFCTVSQEALQALFLLFQFMADVMVSHSRFILYKT